MPNLNSHQKRRAQNLSAQRAYRTRKEEYIKNLEAEVEELKIVQKADERDKLKLIASIKQLSAKLESISAILVNADNGICGLSDVDIYDKDSLRCDQRFSGQDLSVSHEGAFLLGNEGNVITLGTAAAMTETNENWSFPSINSTTFTKTAVAPVSERAEGLDTGHKAACSLKHGGRAMISTQLSPPSDVPYHVASRQFSRATQPIYLWDGSANLPGSDPPQIFYNDEAKSLRSTLDKSTKANANPSATRRKSMAGDSTFDFGFDATQDNGTPSMPVLPSTRGVNVVRKYHQIFQQPQINSSGDARVLAKESSGQTDCWHGICAPTLQGGFSI